MSGKTIVILATLDTKGKETQYVREQIEKLGEAVLVVDVGVVGEPAARGEYHSSGSCRGRWDSSRHVAHRSRSRGCCTNND